MSHGEHVWVLTRDQLRKLVFETSITYAHALRTGCSTQEAELRRSAKLDLELERLPRRTT